MNMKTGLTHGLWLVMAAAMLSCHSEKAAPNVLAKVGDIEITTRDYRKKMIEIAGISTSQALEEPVKLKILNDLIERALLLAEAEQRNLTVSPAELNDEMHRISDSYPGKEFEKMLAMQHITASEWRDDVHKTLLLRKVSQALAEGAVTVDDQAVADYYQQHLEQFKQPAKVRALHIHVDSRETANNILAQLRKGAAFETMAKEYSLGTESQSGGDLGIFPAGVMPEFFDQAIFSLELGKISPIIASEYGFHIFKLVERIPAKTGTLDEVREQIKQTLIDEKRQQQYSSWLEARLKKARVMKNTKLLSKLNL